jgi:hypothetical protein
MRGGPHRTLVALRALAALVAVAPAPAEARAARDPASAIRSLRDLRQDGVVMQRWDLSCGSAALSTILTHDLGDPVSEALVVAAILRRADPVRIRARGGFSLLDLKRFAESRGYEARGYARVSREALAKLAPAILATELGGDAHFVVFRGLRGGRVLLADPAFGNRTMPVAALEAAWPKRIAFVVRKAETAVAATASTPAPPPAAGAAAPSPGDDELAARALERTLVGRGALVLPPGRAEAVAGLAYGHEREPVAATMDGLPAFAEIRAQTAAAFVGVRLGLPARLQLDATLPLVAGDRRVAIGASDERATAPPGLGDARLALTRHLASLRGGSLHLLAAGGWLAPTGTSPYRGGGRGAIARGEGVHAASASLTAVRIAEPLVLVATGTYTARLARETPVGDVDAADTVALSLTSLVAITPGDTLSLGLDVEHGGELRVDRTPVPGTDATVGLARLGISTALSRRVLLTFGAAFGATDDAPDLGLSGTLAVRL